MVSRGLVGPEPFGVGAAVGADPQSGGSHPLLDVLLAPVGVTTGGVSVGFGQEAAPAPVSDRWPGQAEGPLQIGEGQPARVSPGRAWVEGPSGAVATATTCVLVDAATAIEVMLCPSRRRWTQPVTVSASGPGRGR